MRLPSFIIPYDLNRRRNRSILGLLLFCFGKSIGIALGDESIGSNYYGSGDEHDVYTTHYYKYAAMVTICATILVDFSADIIIICARIYLLDVCIIGWFTALRPKYVTDLNRDYRVSKNVYSRSDS